MQKCKMESAKMVNGLCENVEPIPNINTNINQIEKNEIFDYDWLNDKEVS